MLPTLSLGRLGEFGGPAVTSRRLSGETLLGESERLKQASDGMWVEFWASLTHPKDIRSCIEMGILFRDLIEVF